MNKVAAVVVTYNRKELLKECIEALKASTCSVDIIIVDNNSTDGTKEYIADLIGKDVIYKRLKKNLGGAGGFSAGMKYAVKKGYEYVWIMDDDTIVKKDTLEVLLKAKDEISDDFGFISSSVKWIDGSDCKMNRQTYKEQISDLLDLININLELGENKNKRIFVDNNDRPEFASVADIEKYFGFKIVNGKIIDINTGKSID